MEGCRFCWHFFWESTRRSSFRLRMQGTLIATNTAILGDGVRGSFSREPQRSLSILCWFPDRMALIIRSHRCLSYCIRKLLSQSRLMFKENPSRFLSFNLKGFFEDLGKSPLNWLFCSSSLLFPFRHPPSARLSFIVSFQES